MCKVNSPVQALKNVGRDFTSPGKVLKDTVLPFKSDPVPVPDVPPIDPPPMPEAPPAPTPPATNSTLPPPEPPANSTTVAPPPSDKSSEVRDAAREARRVASRRNGLMSTLLANETGGYQGQPKTLLGQ